MKNTLLFVSDDVKIDSLQVDYITAQVKANFDILDAIYFLDKKNKELFLNLDDILFKYKNIIIFCHKKSFPIVNKIISTITKDNLELKMNNMLIPSNSILFEDKSYLLEHEDKRINVIEYTKFQTLPNLLIRSRDEIKYVYLQGLNKISAQDLIDPLASNLNVKVSMCEVVDSLIFLRAQSSKFGDLSSFIDSLKNILDNKIILKKNLVFHIVQTLIKSNKKISFAESCTGGYLSNLFIQQPGSSNIIDANIVSYADSIKEGWLGVESTVLEQFGAVSEQCVRQMLDGITKITNSNLAVAISGIAGPDGGTKDKPVGTVFIGVKNGKTVLIEKLSLQGDRIHIQKSTAWNAIRLLLEIINE